MTLHNLLFCAHTLYMNYVTNTFLLVSFSVRSKQLLSVVQGQVQKSEQKHTTKSIDEFHNHSPLLTMVPRSSQFSSSYALGKPFASRNRYSDIISEFSSQEHQRKETGGYAASKPQNFSVK